MKNLFTICVIAKLPIMSFGQVNDAFLETTNYTDGFFNNSCNTDTGPSPVAAIKRNTNNRYLTKAGGTIYCDLTVS